MHQAAGWSDKYRRHAAGLLVGGVVALGTAGCGSADDTAAISPLNDHIVFESNRDDDNGPGHQELYLIRPDGTGLVRLTTTDEDEADRRFPRMAGISPTPGDRWAATSI